MKAPPKMKAPPRAAAVCVAAIISQHRPNVLPLKREIDLHVSPAVTESLDAMTERKLERIVIDLSRVTYIDSAGLAALILAMQKVQAFGGKFFLAGLDETMRSIFETSRLNQIFQIFPDVDAALAAI
jgi:anti-sigma B factor antagonist